MIELGEAENDEGVVAEAEKALKDLKKEVARRELEALLSGEADRFDSYLEVHAGAGGTESQDWAEMLLAHVYALGRKARFQDRISGRDPGRRGRHQIRHHPDQRPQRLWLAEDRGRRAPAGADLAVRFQRAAAHLVLVGRDLPGGRRQHQDRHQGIRRAHRYHALGRRRRPARQQDRIRGAADAYSDRRCGGLPGRPLAAQEPRAGLGHAAGAALRDRTEEARGAGRRRPGRQDRYRLGSPDPLLRAAALSDGEGSAHRRADLGYLRRARRRSR